MSKTPAYIITSISGSLNQRNKPVFSQAVNNTVALREKCSPYTVVATVKENEKIVKFPFGCISGSV